MQTTGFISPEAEDLLKALVTKAIVLHTNYKFLDFHADSIERNSNSMREHSFSLCLDESLKKTGCNADDENARVDFRTFIPTQVKNSTVKESPKNTLRSVGNCARFSETKR